MHKNKILVVDDEEIIRESLKKILTKEGYDVDAVESASEALKHIYDKEIHLVITEIRRLEIGGIEFIRKIKEYDSSISIIVVTSYGLMDKYEQLMGLGISQYLMKPFSVSEIIWTTRRALETKNLVDSVKDKKQGKKFEELIAEEKKASIRELRGLLRRGKGNPFVAKTGIEPRIFGGRATEIEFFESKLEEALTSYCDHFLVLGNWGVGKSTLLKEFKKKAQEVGNSAALVEIEPFQQGSKVKDGVLSIIQGVYSDLPFPIDKMKSLGKYLKSIGINIVGTGFNFDTSQAFEMQPQALLLDSLVNLWEDVKETQLVAIFLDDVQYFEPILEIFTTLKQTLSSGRVQKKTKFLFILSCTPDKWHKFISLEPHHPVGRYFMSKLELKPLSKEELTDTVLRSLEETDVKFEDDIIELIYHYTSGHPFEMQVLCSNLYDYQIQGKVDRTIWEKALYKTLKDLGDAIFKVWYEQASENEKKILRIIAKSDEPLSIKELKETVKDVDSSLLKGTEKYLQRLHEKNLLSRTERGVYNISDKMFQAYVNYR